MLSHRFLGNLGKLLLVALAVYLTLRVLEDVQWSELGHALARAHWGWAVAVAACFLLRLVAWSWRWNLALARAAAPAPLGFRLAAVAAGMAVNHLTPGARIWGGILRARWGSRSTVATLGESFGAVLYDQLSHQVVMTVLTVLALLVAVERLGYPGLALGGVGLVLLSAALLVVWLRSRGEGVLETILRFLAARAGRSGGRVRRLFLHTEEAARTVGELAREPALWWGCLALGLLFFASNVLAQGAAFLALGVSPPWLVLATVVALGTAAGMLGTPGGSGATEAAMIAAFIAFGLDRLDATAAVLLYRGLHYAVVLLLGLPALAALELRDGGAAEPLEGEVPAGSDR